MKNKKRIIAPMLILLISLQLCGFSLFQKPAVAIDTEQRKVYEYITADTVITDFSNDLAAAERKYMDRPLLLSGKVLSKTGNSITLTGFDRSGYVHCFYEEKLAGQANAFEIGDRVSVYCCYNVDFNIGTMETEKYFSADKITAVSENAVSSELYYTLDGTFFDKTRALERKLGGGHFVYYIPSKWKDIEVNIKDNELGNIEGYQYVLNKTAGSSDNTPESLFVCYFDKNLLKDPADMKKPDLVEKAIIENIDGSVGKFPARKETSYYGARYQYYIGKFANAAELGKGYRTEYVFQADGERGIIMYLYLYREEKHISDVMFVTRFSEIK